MIKYLVIEALSVCTSTMGLKVTVPAHKIMQAYGVRPEECVIFTPPYNIAWQDISGLIVLRYQSDGVYDLSTCGLLLNALKFSPVG